MHPFQINRRPVGKIITLHNGITQLQAQKKDDTDIDKYLNLDVLLSSNAKIEISALLLNGRDTHDVDDSEVYKDVYAQQDYPFIMD